MPPRAGEKVLLTCFADIHYLFSHPKQRPSHHRFEKGSYVYLYHDPNTSIGRVEVANNPGTSEQDAIEGSLPQCSLSYSHKHPCLLSLTISHTNAKISSHGRSWHLRNHDLSHQQEYMYPLHTVDIYFWTISDAQGFLSTSKQLQPVRSEECDVPASQSLSQQNPTNTQMSPIVQRLEQVAISSPFPQHSAHPSQDQHLQNQHYQVPLHQQGRSSTGSTSHSFSPPPPPQQSSPPGTATNNQFAPPPVAAYNPAAPAPPEPIAHREKTPPPEDPMLPGAGLPVSGQGPCGGQHHTGRPQQPYQGYQHQTHAISPPPHQSSFPASAQGASPSAAIQRTGSFPPPPPQQQVPYRSTVPNQPQTFSPPPSAGLPGQSQQRKSSLPFQQYASLSPAPQSPGFSSPQQQQPQPQYSSPMQSPAASSFVTHSPPAATSIHSGGLPDPTSIHSQAYHPSEAELAAHGKNGVAVGYGQGNIGPGQGPGRLEARADRLEKGVNRFLKKLDKKF